MKVWLVTAGQLYDCGFAVEVYGSKLSADMAARKVEDDGNFDWVDVEEVEVK